MNKIINKYLIGKFSKIILNTVLIFLALGVMLNLFEEIEFFKNLNLPFVLPIVLSFSYVPTLIIELLPFIIFLSAMYYLIKLRSSKNLLQIKVFGYSNLKVIMILSFFSFFIGLFFLFALNPLTSTMIKYYETEKAQYSRDVEHLISINKNGVWIKENTELGYNIINSKKLNNEKLEEISIYVFENNKLIKRIESKYADITQNPWNMNSVYIHFTEPNKTEFYENYNFISENSLEKINSLYRNLNTISFLNLIIDYPELITKGYSKRILDEKIHKFISLPFFLFLMVVLASILTMGTLENKPNFYYVLLSILICVFIFYFKDLSIALGQTQKISLILSVWMPIIIIGLICSIGVIQINEK